MKNATAIAVAFSFRDSLYRPLRGFSREEAGTGSQRQKL
ncbi:hypothetical protein N430_02991 [Pseudomonas sp. CC120222-01a]|nr:hypothetical protein N430_02991 [Pseudomonas sp. CC120222-01a]